MGTATSSARANAARPELERRGQVAAHDLNGRLAEVDRAAEVAAHDVAEEHRVLHGQRTVQPSSARTRKISLRGASGGSRSGTGSPDRRMTTKTTVETSQSAIQRAEEPGAEEGEEPAHEPLARGPAGSGPGRPVYARRNLKLKRRISNCWCGFGVHSTYFCRP